MAIDDAPAFALGTKIRKDFPPHGTFDGEVTQLPDDDYNVYTVVYSDEEVKHYTEDELRPLVERYHTEEVASAAAAAAAAAAAPAPPPPVANMVVDPAVNAVAAAAE